MRDEISQRDTAVGLSRMVAGYAWKWSRKDKNAFDIQIGQTRLRWNSVDSTYSISSNKALKEVGSIHTIQGYDLSYVGVIIGLDLRFNPKEC
jgi:DUF2075 family protein